jgi:hypothetical protein
MRLWLVIGLLLTATGAFADVSVVASVDRNHVAFGESVALTIVVQGTQGGSQPSIPRVDGLNFDGPSTQSSFSLNNGQMSQSISFVYQVTPARTGEFTIPAIAVNVGGKSYSTEPIRLVVEKGSGQNDSSQEIFARAMVPSKQVYLGQTEPVGVLVFARADLPYKGLSSFNYEADGLGFKYLPNVKPGTQVINGESYNVGVIQGAISPERTGTLNFGPCILKAQLTVPRRGGRNGWPFDDSMFDQMLPEEGRPADFGGAIGQWKLDVTAKPTDIAVGDPITVTIKVSGNGNIDTVPMPKFGPLDGFKTYDPTTKTTKDDLNTTGERVMQQVLIAKSTDVKELPEVRLAYFDPEARAYKTAVQSPIKLVVKAGTGGRTTIVSGGERLRPDEKLGQDIVYLKGNVGPVAPTAPFYGTATFWVLNVSPVLALLGAVGWKRRTDKLRGDVAYARRTRAAKKARQLLASAASYDEIQHALQHYLGDRLNIPVGGITANVVDEQLVPRGVNGEIADRARSCFEACDTARFAGGGAEANVQATRDNVERLIDELETKQL